MDKRMTIKASSDNFCASVSLALYGENPIPASHTFTFDSEKLPAFTEAVYSLLKKFVGEV